MSVLVTGTAAGQGEQDLPLVPLPSIYDFTRGSGWGAALGASVEYEAAYDGSDEYEVEFGPAGALQWRWGNNMLYWEGIELGWRGLATERLLIQAGARYEDGLDPDDSDEGRLDGIEKRDSHVVGFVEVRGGLDAEWRNWIGARLMGGASDFGWLGVVAAGHRFGSKRDGTGTEIYAFATFGTDDFINKDFGVSAADAVASGMRRTDLSGGYRSTGINLVHRRNLTRHFHLIGTAGVELYSSDIQDSPIARNDYEAELSLSLLYWF